MNEKLIFSAAVLVLTGATVSAALVVDFTENSGTTTDGTKRALTSTNVNSQTWDFDTTTYFTEYAPAGNTNTSFYGGLTKYDSAGISDLNNNQERFQGNNYRFRYLSFSTSLGVTKTAAGAFIWKKEDFLSNTGDQLGLNSLSLNISSLNLDSGGVRMVVEQGGVFYASSTIFTNTAGGLFSITDMEGETWGVLNTTNYSVSAFESQTFDDIQAVGFTFDIARVNNDGSSVLQMIFNDFQADASVMDGLSDPSYFTLDWFNDDEGGVEIATNFTVNIAVNGSGVFSVSPSSSYPATMTFTASGITTLPELFNHQFSLTFGSVNGQPYTMGGTAEGYRIGMNGGDTYRFDNPTEVARITADLSSLDTNLVFGLASFEGGDSVSDFTIGLRDSSGTEHAGGTNQTDLAGIAPKLAGGASDYFDFRAVSGNAGGWGNLKFAFKSSNIPTNTDQPIILANVFGSGCVLQRDQPVKIWGTATPGQVVTVQVKSQTVQALVDGNGDWMAQLAPEPAGGPYSLTVSSAGTASVVLTNVYFGDVWLLAGQSNMFNLLQGLQSDREVTWYYPTPLYRDDPSNNFDDVRYFIVSSVESAVPVQDIVVGDPWTRWQSSGLGHMSIVGYYFTRALNEFFDTHGMANVPIGIIKACRGNTSAEQWISPEALGAMNPPIITEGRSDLLSGYYNGMIKHIQNYAIKGVLWYQGENNSNPIERVEQYPQVMRTLIESWRQEWGIDFPFYYVQLAPHHNFVPTPSDELWAWVRESQTKTLAVTNTAMACIIDIGWQDAVHPPYKNIVGQRLANIALADTYGFNIVHRGPTVSNVQISNSAVIITFDNVADGLRTQAVDAKTNAAEIADGKLPVSVSANVLAGFALCGTNKTFYWATEAKIIATNKVQIANVVDVPKPVNVRYAWQDFPMCNLFNSAGLPAEPFRTDAYDEATASGAAVTAPRLTGSLTATNILVEWQPVTGTWALQSKVSLTGGSWTEVAGSRSNMTATVPLQNSGFFRLKK